MSFHNIKTILKKIENKYVSFYLKNLDLIVLDDIFPQQLSFFRVIEFKEYLIQFKTLILSTSHSFPAVGEKRNFKSVKNEFINNYSLEHKKKFVRKYDENILMNAKLIYFVFKNNGIFFLDYIEKCKIPFVFTLYPGGGFKIDDKESDDALRRIFHSKYFRHVIVTQKISYHYLLEKKFCDVEKISFIYGCPIDNKILNHNVKKNFIDKLVLTFAAHKYSNSGKDKGYDLFIDSIIALRDRGIEVEVNVVGNFTNEDYYLNNLKVNFHGTLNIYELRHLFSNTDIIISPNRPNILGKGSFDGFPTASVIEAGLAGAAMFVSDHLNQNDYFIVGKEIEIVNDDPMDIADKIEFYNDNRDALHSLKLMGQKKLSKFYSPDAQLEKRIQILNRYIQ